MGVTPEVDALVSWVDRAYLASGEIPSYGTMKQRWPSMPWPEKVLPEQFATIELEQSYKRYDVIQFERELNRLVTEGTTNEAFDYAGSFNAMSSASDTPFGVELIDAGMFEKKDVDGLCIPSWGDCMRDRPIHRSDFVLVAARTGVGKSWMLLLAAMDAIQNGWDVVLYSLEMSYEEQAYRMRTLLQTDASGTAKWVTKQPGHLYIADQAASKRGYTSNDIMRRVDKGTNTLVVVDYGELIRPDTGGRTTESWNKSAEVSQSLQNVAKHVAVPVISAVQDNRAAVGTRPGVETLSGSDFWGRDADVVLRLRDETGEPAGNGPTRVLEVVKSRHYGAGMPTYFKFSPDQSGVRVIDRVEYASIHAKE